MPIKPRQSIGEIARKAAGEMFAKGETFRPIRSLDGRELFCVSTTQTDVNGIFWFERGGRKYYVGPRS